MKNISIILITLIVLLVHKDLYSQKKSQEIIEIEAPNQIDPKFDQFWKEFKTAVLSKNKLKLLELCEFPLSGRIPANKRNQNDGVSKKLFSKNYSIIFNKRNSNKIKNTKFVSEKIEENGLEVLADDFDTKGGAIYKYFNNELGKNVYTLSLTYGDKYFTWMFNFTEIDGKIKMYEVIAAQ